MSLWQEELLARLLAVAIASIAVWLGLLLSR